MKAVAVFCGSSSGRLPVYEEAARLMGTELARRGLTLIYGGAQVGLMGAVADAALAQGGQVIGVIPHFLQSKEIAHHHLTELITVESMHERKAKMAELSDGFISLPGGSGTMEEHFEVFTWGQLGLHRKPCALLNVNGYYDPLLTLFDRMGEEQFLQPKFHAMVLHDTDPGHLLDQMMAYEAPEVKSYLNDDQT